MQPTSEPQPIPRSELQVEAETTIKNVADDSELEADTTHAATWLEKSDGQAEPTRRQMITAAALATAIFVAGWFLFDAIRVDETAYAEWSNIEAAASASTDRGTNMLVQRAIDGFSSTAPVIQMNTDDLDSQTSDALRTALWRDDFPAANKQLHKSLAPVADSAVHLDLEASQDLAMAIKRGDSKFFHLQMRDCCHEDGDIVQVAVNGQPYVTIPLTNAGATVSVPLTSGVTLLTLTGVQDGRGGITVQFTTSQGDYFSRPMAVGEEYHIGVATP